MDDSLTLTERTARVARTAIPPWPPLPVAHLSPSQVATALAKVQASWASLIDATTAAAHTHTAAVADFADEVVHIDASTSERLRGGLT
ncbi:hypothetical protein CAPI_08530 [Corynebacterium capitovis DSM 44611]|nr:hypothetical protein CAPI_08530 [Corynebacterium capitovis DSM 44611]